MFTSVFDWQVPCSECALATELNQASAENDNVKGPVSIYVGWGGGKSWGGPGLFFLEKRGGPKENFTMIGGGSLCVL